MKKTKITILFIMMMLCIISCGDTRSPQEIEAEEQGLDYYPDEEIEGDGLPVSENEFNYVDMDIDEGPEGTFYTVPMYFQKDFKNVEIGHLNVSESGNLITCLSMLDSFYSAEYITPKEFIDKYRHCFEENGNYDKIKLMEAVSENNYRHLTITELDVYTLPIYLTEYKVKVLVHINHPSIYGENSSYIIITGLTQDGQLIVRDPNKDNIENYAVVLENGDTVYDTFEFFLEAGTDATMYIMGGAEYDVERYKGHQNIENLGDVLDSAE